MYANAKSTVRTAITVPQLHAMKGKGEKIVMLTAYDASFAAQCDAAGVDAVLVGDMPVDGDAAAANGIGFIAVGWGYGARADLLCHRPQALVADVAELARLVA